MHKAEQSNVVYRISVRDTSSASGTRLSKNANRVRYMPVDRLATVGEYCVKNCVVVSI